MAVESTADKTFFYRITVYTKRGNGELVDHMLWDDLRWDVYLKYQWYFTYRAALLQVKYPKYYVDKAWGPNPTIGEKTYRQIIENRIAARKRKITEYENKIKKARESWTEIFPIEENHIYKRAMEKIDKKRGELLELEEELRSL